MAEAYKRKSRLEMKSHVAAFRVFRFSKIPYADNSRSQY